MRCNVTQDQHMVAFDWLEDHLKSKITVFDLDTTISMIEQVVCDAL